MTRSKALWICSGAVVAGALVWRVLGRDIGLGMAKRRLHALDVSVQADPSDAKSVADLMKMAEDQAYSGTVREGAVQVLGEVGLRRQRPDEIVTFIAKRMTHAEPSYLRQAACDALGDIGAAAAAAVDDILKAMNSQPGSSIEARCARALGKIGADPEKVVPALARLIPNRDPVTDSPSFCRGEELGALAAFGKSALVAVPKLEMAVADPDVTYRQEAVMALAKVEPKNSRLPPAAMSLVTAKDFVARYRGLGALEVCCRQTISGEMAKTLAHATCDSDVENADLARRLLVRSNAAVIAECPSK